jgi:ElaB/YqjD/DUF883 family membrane-anchored ribosome-binding protein
MAERNYVTGLSSSPLITSTERSAEEIRQDIAARRESITETVDELNDRFQETLDWRTYVTNHPLAAVGIAAGLGLLVAGLFKRHLSPQQQIKRALADTVEDMTDRFRSQLDGVGLKRPPLSGTVKAAATGLITKAAADYLRNRWFTGDPRDPHTGEDAADDRYEQYRSRTIT